MMVHADALSIRGIRLSDQSDMPCLETCLIYPNQIHLIVVADNFPSQNISQHTLLHLHSPFCLTNANLPPRRIAKHIFLIDVHPSSQTGAPMYSSLVDAFMRST